MTHQPIATTLQRSCQVEQFEPRTLLTAQALLTVADFAPQADVEILSSQSNSTWYAVSAQNVRDLYGFDGRGQTIAVIDSGIAWDHYAFGNGFGPGHRVVGGWDFAENDANPYDDGPAGFHGTHVAGIVGSQHAVHTGVAPGVDLVALRVFNDQGQGQMEWVRQALRWVSDHRTSFANPITAVNLSLGANWNGNAPPHWAMLETELANLRSQGIFISVAAGNAFQNYQAVGLSYPAASSFVVPVASHGPSGNLSGFSQRNDRVLVAPGESIKSAVPDHLFGGMQSNQFLGASGTSMAAPYVAGASALLRQAFDFMGHNQVGQPTLLQKLVQSADRVYDTATAAWYNRVNLERAIASVIVDVHGDTAATAHSVGHLGQSQVISGTIGTKNDVDWFAFTATASGQLKLHLDTTHQLRAVVQSLGGNAQWDGQTLTINVTAGHQYKLSIQTTDGIGHYQLRAEYAAPNVNAISWGKVFFQERAVSVNGQQMYQLTAGQNGLLSVVGRLQTGNVSFQLLGANMQVIAASQIQGNEMRLDAQVIQDGTYFLRVQGQGSGEFRAINLVQLVGNRLTIHGTNQADQFEYRVAANHQVTVNGIEYTFQASQIRTVMINGRAGADNLILQLGDCQDRITLRPNHIVASNDQFELRGRDLRTIKVDGGAGINDLRMIGSMGSDRFFGSGLTAAMSGTGFANYAYRFASISVNGRGGYDTVDLANSHPLTSHAAVANRYEFTRLGQRVTIFNMEHRVVPQSIAASALVFNTANAWSSPWATSVVYSNGISPSEVSERFGSTLTVADRLRGSETMISTTFSVQLLGDHDDSILPTKEERMTRQALAESQNWTVQETESDDPSLYSVDPQASLAALEALFRRLTP